MAQVSQVNSWRPDPHHLDAFIGQVAKAKAIHERLGAAVNVAQTQVGGEAMTMVYMLTFESGAKYGVFIDGCPTTLNGSHSGQKRSLVRQPNWSRPASTRGSKASSPK